MRTMFDGIIPGEVPAGAQLYAAYLDGHWADFAALVAQHPGAIGVPIAVSASYNGGVVLDIETGDASPAESVDWVLMRRAAGVDPTGYCNTSTWPAVRAAFKARSVTEPHYWLAQYDGVATIPAAWSAAGVVAKQYADKGGYDISVVADYWPGVDRAPAIIEEEITMYVVKVTGTTAVYGLSGSLLWHIADVTSEQAWLAAGGKPVTISAADLANLQASSAQSAGALTPAAVAQAVLAEQGAADTAAAKG